MDNKKRMWNGLVLLVITLFLNLPLASALEISNVQVKVTSSKEAEVWWETDEPANSLVNYGTSQQNLNPVGDASNVLNHSVQLSGLFANTTYYYKVQSGAVVDDNAGNLYSFSTPVPDTIPPEIKVEIPKESVNISVKTGEEVRQALQELEDYENLIEEVDKNDLVRGTIPGTWFLIWKGVRGY